MWDLFSVSFLLYFIVLIWDYHRFNHIYVNQLEIICVGTVALANCHFILWSDIVVVFLVLFELATNNKYHKNVVA